jgi:putative flippase GtrA
VSLACALLHNAVMIGTDLVGLHYVLSSLVSFATVVCFGYWLHGAWTFPAAERGGLPFTRYALSMSLNLPAFIAGMYVCVQFAGLPVVLAAPLVTVTLWLFNFAATRWALRA